MTAFVDWISVSENANLVVAVASAFIAGCALIATIFNARALRIHNKLSVLPYLTTWESVEGEWIVFKLQNNGIGPAIIKSFNIYVDDQKLSGDKLEKHQKCLNIVFSGYEFEWYGSYLGVDYMLPANEERVLAGIKFTGIKKPSQVEFNHSIKRIKVIISYESVYKERRVFDSIEEMKKQESS